VKELILNSLNNQLKGSKEKTSHDDHVAFLISLDVISQKRTQALDFLAVRLDHFLQNKKK